jgi:hypothetical protein
MNEGLHDGRGLPWCNHEHLHFNNRISCRNIVSCQLCDTGWVLDHARVETRKGLVDLLLLFTFLLLAWQYYLVLY